MRVAEVNPRQLPVSPRLSWLGYAVLALIVVWWARRAFHDPQLWDAALAYQAGRLAWASGHPEHLWTWTGTPFLGATMAVVSRAVSMRTAADLLTGISVASWVGAAGVVLYRTHRLLPPAWWWIATFGLMSFAPLMSSVWWKQFNVVVLVLAVAGFELVRQRRIGWGAATIGVSVALKPLVLLLPVIMLARRGTRRAGALALAWVAGLNIAAQGFMALHALDLATLSPLIGIRNVLNKTGSQFQCVALNYSPSSLLCRVAEDTQQHTIWRIGGGLIVLLIGASVVYALRGRSATSWEVFAFACPVSVMASQLEWIHYQILLAPLFFLLLFRFVQEGAGRSAWIALATAFVLASLMWQPFGTLPGTVWQLITGTAETHDVWSNAPHLSFQEGIAQFAQYILLLTGVVWYVTRHAPQNQWRAAARSADHGRAGSRV